MHHLLIPAIFFMCTWLSVAQSTGAETDFMYPIDPPLVLSGTFGELRSNHFHSGLDIKTGGKIGARVYAAMDGYVSRIKISHYGYGKALYVQHPSGHTTVYAHLKDFAPEIDAYVRKRQYTKESYEIELFPKAEELAVEKGKVIAYSGNSGGSGGPHLHFEIRDAKSRPINPLLYGLEVKDTKKPLLKNLWVYSTDTKGHVRYGQKPYRLRLVRRKDGTYTSDPLPALGRIGFGVVATDRQDLAANQNGLYRIRTTVNGQTNFETVMKKFSFAETRYINRLIDYGYFRKNRSRIQKLFIEPNNPLSIFENVIDKGYIDIREGLSYTYKVELYDYEENITMIEIPIIGATDQPILKNEPNRTSFLAESGENFSASAGMFDVYIPKGALYEDIFLDIQDKGDTLYFHNEETPVHKYMSISLDASAYNAEDRKQMFIAELSKRGKPIFVKTTKKGSRFTARTRNFGRFTLAKDTEPPVISNLNFKDRKWISGYRYLKVSIGDELSGIGSYRATLNGKFILMEYDYKTGKLIHDFNDNIATDGENKFKLIVLDNIGNTATLEATFFRKN